MSAKKSLTRPPGYRFETLPLYGSQCVGATVLSGPSGGRYTVRLDTGAEETVPAWEIELRPVAKEPRR